jgi:hypothetical protein
MSKISDVVSKESIKRFIRLLFLSQETELSTLIGETQIQLRTAKNKSEGYEIIKNIKRSNMDGQGYPENLIERVYVTVVNVFCDGELKIPDIEVTKKRMKHHQRKIQFQGEKLRRRLIRILMNIESNEQ